MWRKIHKKIEGKIMAIFIQCSFCALNLMLPAHRQFPAPHKIFKRHDLVDGRLVLPKVTTGALWESWNPNPVFSTAKNSIRYKSYEIRKKQGQLVEALRRHKTGSSGFDSL